jgi:hypothetical protein
MGKGTWMLAIASANAVGVKVAHRSSRGSSVVIINCESVAVIELEITNGEGS